MEGIVFILAALIIISPPIYLISRLLKCIFYEKINLNIINFFNNKIVMFIFDTLIYLMTILGFVFISEGGIEGGSPLSKYEYGGEYLNFYVPLASKHIYTVLTLFVLGIIAYITIKLYSNILSPIVYTLATAIIIINIGLGITFFIHTNVNNIEIPVIMLKIGLLLISILYSIQLKFSLDEFIKDQRKENKKYKNKLLNIIYKFCINYRDMSIFIIAISFPILILIQLILVIFGQHPDSFIRAFLDTSSYNFSKMEVPEPILVHGDGHYLCTVAVKGHRGFVKPIRYGIRHGNKIVVNRQLLVANAFENILEEYTPKLHKIIRYIYDKYGYPISKHINTSFSADMIYIVMKPLEWFFLLVLYIVDKNPENRINIQYSDLRK
ncbi:hypothetical protein SAMN02745163_01901 [Clostridium cavendishii DSM 21758]|uniref:Uncharacterized protein n=1 Tax=Clostridium cavendishii DSM 21758 TaxID=1121302 RepID=A0A1M6J3D8_9CLOT|nr:DUF6688 family protein [Clostridium cavendishii]SHJ41206.1 hypothetical protein SAMN02745163_01901 [Clostridium cavendishii DSM 21758]